MDEEAIGGAVVAEGAAAVADEADARDQGVILAFALGGGADVEDFLEVVDFLEIDLVVVVLVEA